MPSTERTAKPKILVVGEAWGEHEEFLGHPFVGPAGRELVKLLCESNILPRPLKFPWEPTDVRDYWLLHSDAIRLTNTFNFRPPNNDITALCTSAAGDKIAGPPLASGKYLSSLYQPELDRLGRELAASDANVVLALGGTAAWALLGEPGISRIRGTVARAAGPGTRSMGDVEEGIPAFDVGEVLEHKQVSMVGAGDTHLVAAPRTAPIKVLPTYHPAAILRDWSLRAVTVLDLLKANRESAFPDIRRPSRRVFVEPGLADLEWFYETYLSVAELISVDIETQGNHITCIGFAPSPEVALVVPFRDLRQPSWSYWPSSTQEAAAWEWVRKVCMSAVPKLFQNGMYDSHFLWKMAGIPTNVDEDTMLMHHSIYPELQKGLGFLGSVYTNEASWKLMARTTSRKKDE